MENAKELKECLCCGSNDLKLILDLKEQPLANSFKATEEESEPYFPLRLNLCKACTHLQLSHAVNPDLLFKNYLYVSGTSQTYMDYMDWFVDHTQTYFTETPKAVLDIACNDGSQLNKFKAKGLKTYGIDPAENLHKLSSANHEVICDYFTEKYVYHLKNKQIDIINAQNVFAHTDYPLEFLQQCRDIMHDDSRLFIQTSQADMVRNNEFDTIYHEHLSFFNASSMKALADRAGLHLIDIIKTPIHGISYMFVFSKTPTDTSRVDAVLKEESQAGLQDLDTYHIYAEKCKQVVEELKNTLDHYRHEGYVLVGYGAAAKGMTLINFGDLYLDFIIDDNPLKQGRFCPGSNIPVVNGDMLKEVEDMRVVFVPLAWNLFKEIKAKIKLARDRDTDVFIKYFPEIVID
jgi:2-polyprenyl-3-methyl-5-hydroxy-6-metoxy-1,4-benzoquinol methylase